MTSIFVTDVYKVYSQENVTFTDDSYAFYLNEVDANRPPMLIIAGQVEVRLLATSSQSSTRGVLAGNGFQTNGVFTIDSTGVLRVTSSAPNADASGFGGGSWTPNVVNKGLLEVTSLGFATGIAADSGLTDNQGTIRVTGANGATGVVLYWGGTFHNSGTIEVSGGGYNSPFGFATGGYTTNFLNDVTGVIRATSTSPTTPRAVAVEWGVGYQSGQWVNKGLIQGDIALRSQVFSAHDNTFQNSGVMLGDVLLDYGRDVLNNSGRIEGAVTLGVMDDYYNGGGGVLKGLLSAGDGNDQLYGGAGAETMSGDAGDDLISGFGGSDSLDGGRGDDELRGGGANLVTDAGSTLDGGLGFDTLSYRYAPKALLVDLVAGTASGTVIRNFEHVVGSYYADRIVGSAAGEVLDGGDNGDDTILGGGGDDSSQAVAGQTFLRGEDGADRLLGGAGFDNMQGNTGNDTLNGGAASDWVLGGKDNDQVFGGDGADIINGNLGEDSCEGGSGDDVVRGGQGNDGLQGGDGADWLSGDRGDDTLTGGTGADIFNFFAGAGADRVMDFNAADGDRVRLEGAQAYTARQAGADVVIDLGHGDQMTLVGVSLTNLPADWIG